ncbi:hypothetical protein HDV01_006679 [Terramyces sp. JEL0728]|nr:hypothetical protein HDV01_006679 [Terramyces sp. JEL0728]
MEIVKPKSRHLIHRIAIELFDYELGYVMYTLTYQIHSIWIIFVFIFDAIPNLTLFFYVKTFYDQTEQNLLTIYQLNARLFYLIAVQLINTILYAILSLIQNQTDWVGSDRNFLAINGINQFIYMVHSVTIVWIYNEMKIITQREMDVESQHAHEGELLLQEENRNQTENLTIWGIHISFPRAQRFSVILFTSIVIFFTVIVGFLIGILIPRMKANPKPRNVVLMISDGFGPASQTFARNYYQYINQLPNGTMLPLDEILVGSSRTRSGSSLITDSAAGATAFSCGLKSYNGAIGVDLSGKPCGTVLEAAKEIGYYTGLVATSRITHATPASFAAHVIGREDEAAIALQEIGDYTLGRRVDLLFGGGKCYFLPNSTTGSCRKDNIDALDKAASSGWNVGNGLDEFKNLKSNQLPVMNLFALDHMSYDIDRDETQQPALYEMAEKALDLLGAAARNNNRGFFLMIEGSRIDMAAHSNDPATHVHDILAYNNAIAKVKEYCKRNPDTVMISVSDHETGGFSVGHQLGAAYPGESNVILEYLWRPEELTAVKHSGEYIAQQLMTQTVLARKDFIQDIIFKKWMGINTPNPDNVNYLLNTTLSATEIEYKIGQIKSELAGLGWSTHGHSAVDVNLYAFGPRSDELRGNHENTDIGQFIVRNLGLKLAPLTDKLNL